MFPHVQRTAQCPIPGTSQRSVRLQGHLRIPETVCPPCSNEGLKILFLQCLLLALSGEIIAEMPHHALHELVERVLTECFHLFRSNLKQLEHSCILSLWEKPDLSLFRKLNADYV